MSTGTPVISSNTTPILVWAGVLSNRSQVWNRSQVCPHPKIYLLIIIISNLMWKTRVDMTTFLWRWFAPSTANNWKWTLIFQTHLCPQKIVRILSPESRAATSSSLRATCKYSGLYKIERSLRPSESTTIKNKWWAIWKLK